MDTFKMSKFSFKRHDNTRFNNRPQINEADAAVKSSGDEESGKAKPAHQPLPESFSQARLDTTRSPESYGVGGIFEMFPSRLKQNEKQICTLVVVDLRRIEKSLKSKRKEIVLTMIRNEPLNLMTLKHSRIIQILHGLEETHDHITYSIEVVTCNLKSLVQNKQSLTELEITSGIYQITEGLKYIHLSLNKVHCNICPTSILLTSDLQWKIASFNFLEKVQDISRGQEKFKGFDPKRSRLLQPDLDFIAPEVQIDHSLSDLADMYSLGLVICSIYNEANSLVQAHCDVDLYKKEVNELQRRFNQISDRLPKALKDPVEKMISRDIDKRPHSNNFLCLKVFHEETLTSFITLMNLENEPVKKRKEFFNKFATQIREYNTTFIHKRILPHLKRWCFSSSDLTPFVVPSIITLITLSNKQDYQEHLETTFKVIIKSYNDPQIGFVLLDLLQFFITRLTEEELRLYIVEAFLNCIKSESQKSALLLESAAKCIAFHNSSDLCRYIYDKFKEILTDGKTYSAEVKTNTVKCLRAFVPLFDSDFLVNDILPLLSSVCSENSSILQEVLFIYQQVLLEMHVDVPYPFIAKRLLPPLIPFLSDKTIRVNEYKLLIDSCRKFIEVIDRGRMKELSIEINSQSGSCSSINSQLYSSQFYSANLNHRLPLISMQQPTIDHEGSHRLSDYHFSLKNASGSESGSQLDFDSSRPRSNSSEYYRRSSGDELHTFKGSCMSILNSNRKRATSQCSESIFAHFQNKSSLGSLNNQHGLLSSSSGRLGQFVRSPLSGSNKNITTGSNQHFPLKSLISFTDSNFSGLSPRGSVSSARNHSPSTTSLINQAIERRRYSGNTKYSPTFQQYTPGSSHRTSLSKLMIDPRRHSYGSSAPSSVQNLITRNVCEGPFMSPQNSRFNSRRTSAQSVSASKVNSLLDVSIEEKPPEKNRFQNMFGFNDFLVSPGQDYAITCGIGHCSLKKLT